MNRKNVLLTIAILLCSFLFTGCTLLSPYSQEEVIQYVQEYYGEGTIYNGCEDGENSLFREKCTDYHFTAQEGFDFTVTSGINKARKWIFLVIHTPFMESDYLEQMTDHYADELNRMIDASGLDAAWQDNETGRSLRFTIEDDTQIPQASQMICDLQAVMAPALPQAQEDLPVTLVQGLSVYGYRPVEQDEVGIYWGDLTQPHTVEEVQQTMQQQYQENYTDMHYGQVPEE